MEMTRASEGSEGEERGERGQGRWGRSQGLDEDNNDKGGGDLCACAWLPLVIVYISDISEAVGLRLQVCIHTLPREPMRVLFELKMGHLLF
jgi:hypothetical protein